MKRFDFFGPSSPPRAIVIKPPARVARTRIKALTRRMITITFIRYDIPFPYQFGNHRRKRYFRRYELNISDIENHLSDYNAKVGNDKN